MYIAAVLSLLLPSARAGGNSPVSAYGHAYQAPGDFSDKEFEQIASRFPVFTVEKRHAFGIYGDKNAPSDSPRRYNSIKAAVETARKIKALNPNTKVLMYWNAAIHFNMYECEAAVNASWLMPADFHPSQKKGLYNYSVPEFRQWWVDCAVNSVLGSKGMLDGVFLDATPKVTWQHALLHWNDMVDELQERMGNRRLVMYNGFFVPKGDSDPASHVKAGADQLAHANLYDESFGQTVSAGGNATLGFLGALQTALKENPSRMLFGHASPTLANFSYTYGCFLMVAPKAGAYFLSNEGYRVDQGLLDEHVEYALGLGSPVGDFKVNGLRLTRSFEHGTARVDLKRRTATFDVDPPPQAYV